jgi:SAM-dependent methyltransferase
MSRLFDDYADYYDLLYRDKDYAGEARYLQSLLARHGKTRGGFLDLGCGTGRHAIELVRLGYDGYGIDASDRMIGHARARTPPELKSRLAFEIGDVRSARLGRRFDAVLALFHVASYQTTNEDLAAMLATVREHLAPDGVFVCDFWHGPGVLRDPPQTRIKTVEGARGRVTRIAEPSIQAGEHCVDVRYTLLVEQGASDGVTRLTETHRVRYLFLHELRGLLAGAGLRLGEAYEWMGGALGAASWNAVITAGHSPHFAQVNAIQ